MRVLTLAASPKHNQQHFETRSTFIPPQPPSEINHRLCRGRHRTMSATASWRHVSLSLSEFPLPVVSSLVPISLGNLSQFESTRVGWRGRGRVDKRSEIGEVHNSFFVCRELHRRRPGQNLHYFPPNTPPPTTSHSGASQRPLLVPATAPLSVYFMV